MLRRNLYLAYKLSLRENIPNTININIIRRCASNIEKTDKITLKPSTYKSVEDTFGILNVTHKVTSEELTDEGDILEEKFLQNLSPTSKRLSTKGYADMIKGYISKRQIKEAIDVVEIKMIQEDKVKPENYIYNLLLGACGRVGYTKKAFQLFNQMKKRGLQPTGGTYTALFNACANSPWPEDGLTRAKNLKELMIEKGFQPNDTTCNSMIKAFGRCGDIQLAFAVVDDMIQKQIPVKTEVVNFLISSCITKKESGYLHALLVWRKFKQNKIKPDIYSYNLILHCIRECQLGDSEVAKNLLECNTISTDLINKKQISNDSVEIDNKIEIMSNIPNLLADIPNLGNMVEINKISTPDQRLLLVGGCAGFLNNMKNNNVVPNIKTFTILLDNIPKTTTAEIALLNAMKKAHVKPDIDFLNMLIKKRSIRFDYEGAKEVLEIFEKYKYKPNIFTYGILALGCKTLEESRMLLKEMLDSGYRINIEILGAMVRQASVKENFVYVLEIMEIVIKERIHPNKFFLQHLEKFHKDCMEKAKNEEKKGAFWSKGFHLFRMRYKGWLEQIQPDSTETSHPWEQFRKPVETKVKNYKDPTVHFKPRVTSHYKQKTGTLKYRK